MGIYLATYISGSRPSTPLSMMPRHMVPKKILGLKAPLFHARFALRPSRTMQPANVLLSSSREDRRGFVAKVGFGGKG